MEATVDITIDREPYPALFRQIGPQVYRANPFRILDLPADASAPEIRRRVDLLQKSRALGIPPPAARGLLALGALPPEDVLGEAVQRLRDPEKRIIDELFWFWPEEPGGRDWDDAAISALSRGDVDAALKLWEEKGSEVGCHNLAVYHHTLVLDLELARQHRPLTSDEESRRDQLWPVALRRWQTLAAEETFWGRFVRRILEVNDPRLKQGDALSIRQLLPLAVLSINAQLAVTAHRNARGEDRDRHLNLVRGSGFAEDVAEEALRLVLEPERQNLRLLSGGVIAGAKQEPSRADEITSLMLSRAAPHLDLLDVLPADHPLRVAAHDDVAQSAYEALSEFHRFHLNLDGRGEAAAKAVAILSQIRAIAVSAQLCAQLQESIDDSAAFVQMGAPTVESFESLGDAGRSCWFCGKNPPLRDVSPPIMMQRDADRRLVLVPRCRRCLRRQRQASVLSRGAFVLCVLVIVLFLFKKGSDASWWSLILQCVFQAVFFSMTLHGIFLGGRKDEDAAKKFPAVLKHKNDGYKIID